MTYNWHLYVIWDHQWAFVRGAWITAQPTFFALLLLVFVGPSAWPDARAKHATLRQGWRLRGGCEGNFFPKGRGAVRGPRNHENLSLRHETKREYPSRHIVD